MFLSTELFVAIAGKFLLCLPHQSVEPSLNIGQTVANMGHQSRIESLCQKLRSTTVRHIPISGMVPEKLLFRLQRLSQWLAALNVLLRSIDNANEAQFQGVNPTSENIQSVCTMVHEVQFGQHTNRPPSHGIYLAGEFQSLGVDKINVGRRHRKDNAVWLRNIFGNQCTSLFLNVRRLVPNWNFCQTGEVDKS